MPLPRQIPEGLNGRQYTILSLQYLVIQDWTNAAAAQSRAVKCDRTDFLGTPLENVSKEDFGKANFITTFVSRGFAAGKQISEVAAFVTHEVSSTFYKGSAALDNAIAAFPRLKDAKEKLGSIWNNAEQQLSSVVGKTIEGAVLKHVPSRDIPEGLSAKEYFDLGVRYKDMGWTEQSRDALNKAMELDGSGPIAAQAAAFIKTRLPVHPVPHAAIQRNILGFNYMVANRTEEARKTFEQLIEDYPTFEWPYSNLGRLYTRMNETVKAKPLLRRALSINPSYANAWCGLALAMILDSEFDDARVCLQQAEKLDPQNPTAITVKHMLDTIDQFR